MAVRVAEALASVHEAERIIEREGFAAHAEERAEAVARLIWDHAEDRDFLLAVLPEEIAGAEGVLNLQGWPSYFVRCVLHFLAEELDEQCPHRGPYEGGH